jgi:hypothetical protein
LVAVDEHLLNFGYGNAITYDYIFLEELSKYNHIPFEEHFELDGLLWFPFDSYERKFFVSIKYFDGNFHFISYTIICRSTLYSIFLGYWCNHINKCPKHKLNYRSGNTFTRTLSISPKQYKK